jgi:hypothetical protein
MKYFVNNIIWQTSQNYLRKKILKILKILKIIKSHLTIIDHYFKQRSTNYNFTCYFYCILKFHN